jgi:sulfur relay (sulfurtransferase) complex TusBCD TusD component (DsrE family)
MKLGMIITQTDAETVFNALRLALYSLQQGDEVRLFFSGKGVEIDQIEDAKFDVKQQAQKVLEAGAQFFACGACLKLRDAKGSEICPLSTLKDQYEIVRDSDKVIMV